MKLNTRFHGLWNRNTKFLGLQIMTVGFLCAVAGAGLALLNAVIRDCNEIQSALYLFSKISVYLGWGVLCLGGLIMFVGIVIHWWYLFRN